MKDLSVEINHNKMNKFDRITAILIHLQSKKLVRAKELSDRFGVSLRTIYRDIETLINAGVPIIGEVGVGYSIMEGYRLPPIMFTQEEAIAFLMAEKIADKYVDAQNMKNFESALFKVKSVLRNSEKRTTEEMNSRISVVKNAQQNTVIDKNLPLIIQSLTNKETLQITYTEFDPSTTKLHSIEPIGIINENGIWNSIAYSNESKTYRHFRLDRIATIKLIGISFKQNLLSLKEYTESQKKQEKTYNPIIKIKKEVAHFIEEQKYKYGFVSEKENGTNIEMEFKTTCLQTFSRWFLTFADNATIIEPNELKVLFKEVVTGILKNI